jgi:hypothetical protein
VEYNYILLKWDTPTPVNLPLKNNGTGEKRLLSIVQPDDARVVVTTNKTLHYDIAPNETIQINVTFYPDGSVAPVNTSFKLIFECNEISINIRGLISAPGLLADDLDFDKVRLYESKVLTGRIYNAGNIGISVDSISKDIDVPEFVWADKIFPVNLPIDANTDYSVTFTPTEKKTYLVNCGVANDNSLNCGFYVKGTGAAPNIENIVVD